MKLKKLTPLWRGLAAVTASCMTLAVIGSSIADNYRSQIDEAFGTQSYITEEDADAKYSADYTAEQLKEKLVEFSINQGEEGAVLLKNTNGVLPLSSTAKVALFGGASYNNYKSGGGNSDAATLVSALTDAGITIDPGVSDAYSGEHGLLGVVTGESEQPGRWPGAPSTVVQTYGFRPNTSLGDYDPNGYQIREADPSKTYEVTGDKATEINANISTALQALNTAADELTDDVIGIVTFMRPGGEGNTYYPGVARDTMGNTLNQNPLALSPEEIGVVDFAKEHCSKVIVLLNTCVPMEIQPLVSGEHAVDGIMYVGVPNDYQFKGIVNVLTGKVNATGALMDTYAVSTTSSPAMRNFGGSTWADYTIVATTAGQDPRWNVDVSNETTGSFGGVASYAASTYVVEAEGIYVGYKYFETRYFDSIANADTSNANGTAGSTDGQAWDYHKEVVYSFGHGLSYYDYTQKIQSVKVDLSEDGEISAEIEVTNNSNTKALFLAQLYVSKPYEEGQVEKSAVDFLNSGKIEVDANSSDTITVSIPTKYLASWDSAANNGKGGWILDKGDYIFTAAAGSHAAVNNVLAHLGYGEDIDTDKVGDTKVWNLSNRNETALSVDNGTEVKNAAANADLNYFLPNTVTYLSRSDWQGTYPVNYNTDPITIGGDKVEEWIKEIRNQQYTIKNNEPVADPDGTIPTGFTVTENADGSKTGTWQLIVDALMTADGTLDVDNIDSELWDKVAKSITVDNAIGAVVHGGNRSDELDNLHNPIVLQNEGVNGYTTGYTEEGSDKTYKFNVNSMTLLGSSFDPDLAWEWGVLEGESGLWVQRYDIWGVGLTLRRTPYNGRNFEYASEDPMRTNRVGYGVMGGALTKGSLVGPKHFGFNDQEHFRNGVALYMTEQKVRETDLRGFQGGLDDAKGLAVMVSFSRVGATNVSCHQGLLKQILRDEWGFKGLISTDMNNGNDPYFDAASLIMATVTQVADFGANDQTIVGATGGWSASASWEYLTLDTAKNDATLVNRARQNLKYQLYAFANSAVLNITTTRVTPWWEAAINAVAIVGGIVFGLSTVAWIVTELLPEKKKEEE